MTEAIELWGITKSFPQAEGADIDVLHDLEFSVPKGTVAAIVGRSGSGKSTLLNILGLLDSPSSGTYRIGDVDTTKLDRRKQAQLRGQQIGFVFQQFHLLSHFTAIQNVAEPLLLGTSNERRGRLDRASDLLERVGMSNRAQQKPSTLSGGEQQRVAIARALARKPQLLLADEPTGSLDPETADQVLDLLFELAIDQGTTVVLVTHDPVVAERAGTIFELTHGQISSKSLSV